MNQTILKNMIAEWLEEFTLPTLISRDDDLLPASIFLPVLPVCLRKRPQKPTPTGQQAHLGELLSLSSGSLFHPLRRQVFLFAPATGYEPQKDLSHGSGLYRPDGGGT